MGLEPVYVHGNTIIPGKLKWMWPGRIPFGELSIIAGNPGVGKSYLGVYMAAQVTKGGRWPDCKESAGIGKVCILTAEDSLKYTASVRLLAADADMNKVSFIVGAVCEEKAISIYRLAAFAPLIGIALAQDPEIKLVIIDPITAYMGGKNENRNIEVREFLAPLAEVAARFQVAIVGITHLNKDATKVAMFRMLGSIGFTAAARAAWLVIQDADFEERRLLLPIKINVAEKVTGISFHLAKKTVGTEDGPTISGVCEFDSRPIFKTADEVFADQLVPLETKHEQAKKWILEQLEDRARPMSELVENAKHQQIARRTLERVKKDLGIETYAMMVGDRAVWMCKLPQE